MELSGVGLEEVSFQRLMQTSKTLTFRLTDRVISSSAYRPQQAIRSFWGVVKFRPPISAPMALSLVPKTLPYSPKYNLQPGGPNMHLLDLKLGPKAQALLLILFSRHLEHPHLATESPP